MIRKVILSIRSQQDSGNGAENSVQEETGTLLSFDHGFTFSFSHNDDENGPGYKMSVTADNDSVTIKHSGQSRYTVTVREGTRSECSYETSYGDLLLGFTAKKIEAYNDERGAYISLSYDIDSDGSLLSKNEMTIKTREII